MSRDLKCAVGKHNAFASFIFFSQPEISDHVAVHKINRSIYKILTGATKGRPLCVFYTVWQCLSIILPYRTKFVPVVLRKHTTHTAVKWFQISQLITAALLFHADVSSHNIMKQHVGVAVVKARGAKTRAVFTFTELALLGKEKKYFAWI